MKRKVSYLVLFLYIFPIVISAQEEESCSIPNGDFEIWNGDTPVNWGSTNVTQNSSRVPEDFKSIFKSTDSKSGKYAIHLKNPSTVDYLNKNKDYVKAMSQYPQYRKMAEDMMKKQSLSASIFWCNGDCNSVMISNPLNITDKIQIPVKEKPKAICGFYKTNLKGGDKLWINPFLIASDGSAGGPAPGETKAVITNNTNEWTAFKIPLNIQDNKVVKSAGVQFYIVGSDFPNKPPYGTNGMQLAMTIPGTEKSEVWLDDICFCDAPEMEIFNAEALDGKKINPALMLEMGAQTVVNLDNDDKSETYDYDPETGISKTNLTKIDDDLVKLRIKVPYSGEPNPPEEIVFEQTKGDKNVLLWKDNKKIEKFNPNTPLFIPTDFEKIGNFWIKEIWVEGIEAHTEQRGTVFKMYPKNDPQNFQKAALTIIGIEKLEWEGRNNSINNDNNLDYDVNFRIPSDPFPETPGGKVQCSCDDINESNSFLSPGARRVFPGKRIKSLGKTEDELRNKVTLNVALSVKPIYPIKVYFKSFDVDDPTLESSSIDEMDKESQAEDNIGFIEKNGVKLKSGFLEGQDKDGILKVDFIESTKQLTFEVSIQPGDNFRVVGAFDKEFIKTLENDDSKLNTSSSEAERHNDKQRIVDPSVLKPNEDEIRKAEIRLSENYASNVLSVWRIAYAEVDKMGPIGKDVMFSKIVSYDLNSPKNGQTKIFIEDNIISKLEEDGVTKPTMEVASDHKSVGIKNAFKEGEFKVQSQNFKILENSANEAGYILNGAADYIVIEGLLTGIDDYEGKVCGLKFDDERKWGFKAGDAMPDLNPDKCVLERIFRPTYVVVDFETLENFNPKKETKFIRNTNADDFEELKSNYLFDNINLAEDPEFWCFYVNTCYAGATAEDGDPDDGNIPGAWENAITGIADDEKLGINIFMEGLLEFNKLNSFHRDKYLCTVRDVGSGKGDVIAHEIAHLFGAVHEIDLAIMMIQANHFSELTISRIRKGKHP